MDAEKERVRVRWSNQARPAGTAPAPVVTAVVVLANAKLEAAVETSVLKLHPPTPHGSPRASCHF